MSATVPPPLLPSFEAQLACRSLTPLTSALLRHVLDGTIGGGNGDAATSANVAASLPPSQAALLYKYALVPFSDAQTPEEVCSAVLTEYDVRGHKQRELADLTRRFTSISGGATTAEPSFLSYYNRENARGNRRYEALCAREEALESFIIKDLLREDGFPRADTEMNA